MWYKIEIIWYFIIVSVVINVKIILFVTPTDVVTYDSGRTNFSFNVKATVFKNNNILCKLHGVVVLFNPFNKENLFTYFTSPMDIIKDRGIKIKFEQLSNATWVMLH